VPFAVNVGAGNVLPVIRRGSQNFKFSNFYVLFPVGFVSNQKIIPEVKYRFVWGLNDNTFYLLSMSVARNCALICSKSKIICLSLLMTHIKSQLDIKLSRNVGKGWTTQQLSTRPPANSLRI
jgi:hypothetical protein